MDTERMKAMGASLAARHARNKARMEREEGRSDVQIVAAIVTGVAVVVLALMMMF